MGRGGGGGYGGVSHQIKFGFRLHSIAQHGLASSHYCIYIWYFERGLPNVYIAVYFAVKA